MINAIKQTLPGWEGEHKLARTVDGLCKLHGPRGYGSAASFSLTDYAWKLTDRTMKLDRDLPDTTDVGRLWNEGLAFYGWLFYLSKFYEIVDTFIILVKGKNTSTLQTFHHAGAMFCTWAGIRFMSPPIWMFVIVNSGIHTLMVGSHLDEPRVIVLIFPSTPTTPSITLVSMSHSDSSPP